MSIFEFLCKNAETIFLLNKSFTSVVIFSIKHLRILPYIEVFKDEAAALCNLCCYVVLGDCIV